MGQAYLAQSRRGYYAFIRGGRHSIRGPSLYGVVDRYLRHGKSVVLIMEGRGWDDVKGILVPEEFLS